MMITKKDRSSQRRIPLRWLLLRGLVREAGHWGRFPDLLQEAFRGADIRCLDIEGNGRKFQRPSPLSVRAMANELRAEARAIAHQSPAEKTALLALSLGGMIAIQWLCDDPSDLDGCVLVNTSVRGLSPLHHRLSPRAWPVLFRGLWGRETPEEQERRMLGLISNEPGRRAEVLGEWLRVQAQRPVSPPNALRQLLAAARFRLPPAPPGRPLLVLSGGGDRLVDPRCSERLAAHWGLPSAQHPTAGHALTLDQGEWAASTMKSWAADIGLVS